MACLLSSLGLCGLTSCLAEGLCMAARLCCCSMSAAAGSRGGSSVSTRAAKSFYIAILAVSAIFALVLYAYGDQIPFLSDISAIANICTGNGTTVSQCYGASAVLRISLALAVFFGVNTLLAASANAFVGCWGAKTLLWLGLVIGCFFVPATAIAQYAQAARVFSIFFLLAMVIILIDAAYHVHEWLTGKIEATDSALAATHTTVGCCQNWWRIAYLLLAFAAIIGSLAGIGVLYKFSANVPGATCSSNLAFLSITLLAGVVYIVFSLFACTGARGILPPALVFAYNTWLVWSAIYANPETVCSPMQPNASNTGATIVGMIIAAFSLCYTAFSASRSMPHLFDSKKKGASALTTAGEEADPLAANAHPTGAGKKGSDDDDDDEEKGTAAAYAAKAGSGKAHTAASEAAEPYSVAGSLLFSLIMVLAAMYMAPVLTNWVTDPSPNNSHSSAGTMWVNIAAQWATTLLYFWTLIAPAVCKNRDFS